MNNVLVSVLQRYIPSFENVDIVLRKIFTSRPKFYFTLILVIIISRVVAWIHSCTYSSIFPHFSLHNFLQTILAINGLVNYDISSWLIKIIYNKSKWIRFWGCYYSNITHTLILPPLQIFICLVFLTKIDGFRDFGNSRYEDVLPNGCFLREKSV